MEDFDVVYDEVLRKWVLFKNIDHSDAEGNLGMTSEIIDTFDSALEAYTALRFMGN